MTLRHMRIFISVYERKSITNAANDLHLTQPAVSRAICEIESHYGLQLFIRLRSGVSPTEAGVRLYEQTQHIVYSFNNMESIMADMHNNIIRIDCCALLGQSYLPLCISRFNKLYPQLSVKVTISRSSDNILSALQHKKIDMAILETKIDSNNSFLVKKLFEYHLVPVFPPHHPFAQKDHLMLEEMESCDFVCTEKGRPLRVYMDELFSAHGLKFEPQWECVSTQGIINAVSQGHGISFLPYGAIENALQDGSVATRSIENEDFLRNIYIMYPKEHMRSCSKSFLEFIISDSNQYTEDRFS